MVVIGNLRRDDSIFMTLFSRHSPRERFVLAPWQWRLRRRLFISRFFSVILLTISVSTHRLFTASLYIFFPPRTRSYKIKLPPLLRFPAPPFKGCPTQGTSKLSKLRLHQSMSPQGPHLYSTYICITHVCMKSQTSPVYWVN